ncbi:Voltage-dependent L-type calcium channel subunit alpha-1D [Gossypium arboreum]|uniref:Voltage-dependent L-type calcium channel subunit alpha-1D n=1 Tax=Gossypium arboreum TaxID=29729 RepID=A0A0B0PN83_GOSAR|nr:Voltage-dependent L-type calcium channel subunit alpha-1D [Gossypium arboreum]
MSKPFPSHSNKSKDMYPHSHVSVRHSHENRRKQNSGFKSQATSMASVGRPSRNIGNEASRKSVARDTTVKSEAKALAKAYAIRAREDASSPDVITAGLVRPTDGWVIWHVLWIRDSLSLAMYVALMCELAVYPIVFRVFNRGLGHFVMSHID